MIVLESEESPKRNGMFTVYRDGVEYVTGKSVLFKAARKLLEDGESPEDFFTIQDTHTCTTIYQPISIGWAASKDVTEPDKEPAKIIDFVAYKERVSEHPEGTRADWYGEDE